MNDPTQRFSSRVENYIKYRPGYPQAVVSTLQRECGLVPDSVVADVGSGTGILSEMFLRNGNAVYGIEPNTAMRQAGEHLLERYASFYSVNGTAEDTTLEEKSVDFITAGQAFHWFDRDRCRREFERILRPEGWIVLVWNERQVATTPFLQAYEELLEAYATDYQEVNHTRIDEETIARFYAPGRCELHSFSNFQVLNFEALQGRVLSSSYVPEAGHPHYEPMLAALHRLFETHQENGTVRFEYETNLHLGRFTSSA
jgi:SAM-dependent methyltransferase